MDNNNFKKEKAKMFSKEQTGFEKNGLKWLQINSPKCPHIY